MNMLSHNDTALVLFCTMVYTVSAALLLYLPATVLYRSYVKHHRKSSYSSLKH